MIADGEDAQREREEDDTNRENHAKNVSEEGREVKEKNTEEKDSDADEVSCPQLAVIFTWFTYVNMLQEQRDLTHENSVWHLIREVVDPMPDDWGHTVALPWNEWQKRSQDAINNGADPKGVTVEILDDYFGHPFHPYNTPSPEDHATAAKLSKTDFVAAQMLDPRFMWCSGDVLWEICGVVLETAFLMDGDNSALIKFTLILVDMCRETYTYLGLPVSNTFFLSA